MLKSGNIDLIGNMVQTEDRDKYALFTTPIYTFPSVIFCRKNTILASLEDLNGKTVALIEGIWYQEMIEKDYPDITLMLVDNQVAALNAVAYGKADATIGVGAILQYLITENLIPNISISGQANFKDVEKYYECIGVRKEMPILRNLLQKAMNTITYQEEQQLRLKWLVTQKPNKTQNLKKIQLTEEEDAFIKIHPVIQISNEMDWPPFDFMIGD